MSYPLVRYLTLWLSDQFIAWRTEINKRNKANQKEIPSLFPLFSGNMLNS